MSYRFLVLTIALILPWLVGSVQAVDDHDNNTAAQTTQADNDQHDDDDSEAGDHPGEADHDDADEAGHSDHADELAIELSPQAVALAGITTSIAAHGRISRTIELPGEVGFNEDQLAHIAPRFAGIAQEARYRVGDYIDEGSVVSVDESN